MSNLLDEKGIRSRVARVTKALIEQDTPSEEDAAVMGELVANVLVGINEIARSLQVLADHTIKAAEAADRMSAELLRQEAKGH
jgi:hypothetical protein